MIGKLEQLKSTLERRGYCVQLLKNAEAVRDYLLDAIGPQDVVGIGGSMSVKECGIDQMLAERGNPIFWHWTAAPREIGETRHRANQADTYLTSTNAITEAGQLVNIDGFGNRLAAMAFGPKKVYVIVGQNKLCPDLEAAMKRVKTQACPPNARRLGLNTPCAKTGQCVDCNSPQRFCNATLILDRCPGSHPMEIILVQQDMGY